ncbi:Uncharacterized protein Deba_0381 [hydrothermal vent metagenome]|uniref:Uncharacterized protein Deba_0381 n=1 Tax=hydrothermal vent metagenome TaxID=652676 RepID=A0A3B1BC55_9ZZZZ
MKSSKICSIENVRDILLDKHELVSDSLSLVIGKFSLDIYSNSQRLLDRLESYFSNIVTQSSQTSIEIIAIESDAVELNLNFIDWPREQGKTGRKDSYIDLDDGRVLRKVRTGMIFLQSRTLRMAAGPCLANENQIVNFINSQYMTWLQQNGWLICHAAGLVYKDTAYAFAGFSGGGKSTLMLHLLNHENTAYLTNDRLFIKSEKGHISAAGIPKLPRINPGTIVHNPRLHGLITEQQRQAFLAMPAEKLWDLEDKYDVFIDKIYGANRILAQAPLGALIILNWQRDSESDLIVEKVELATRLDLLDAVMKSPGPFYQYPDGAFYSNTTALPTQRYLDALKNIDVYEVKGQVDFDKLNCYCQENIFG